MAGTPIRRRITSSLVRYVSDQCNAGGGSAIRFTRSDCIQNRRDIVGGAVRMVQLFPRNCIHCHRLISQQRLLFWFVLSANQPPIVNCVRWKPDVFTLSRSALVRITNKHTDSEWTDGCFSVSMGLCQLHAGTCLNHGTAPPQTFHVATQPEDQKSHDP